MNTLVVGMTQSGKSTAELKRLTEWDGACVDLRSAQHAWPNGTSSDLTCCDKLEDVVYDDLARVDKVLSWSFIEPSKKTGRDRLKENDDRARDFADILCRRRGLQLHQRASTEEWSIAALKLWLYQKSPKAITDLVEIFHPGKSKRRNPKFNDLKLDCEIPELRDKFEELCSMTQHQRRSEVRCGAEVV